ncbi:hypothetical protein L6452_02165 [Arctium lappa]|uniref:Uncharacterized protein n=1 Tax=Arctium lappa TaxID=4217 RepID=A0ACB9FIN7_ARCLA|nr:hypothetical protein L6452_02165 [Arctium lappa]
MGKLTVENIWGIWNGTNKNDIDGIGIDGTGNDGIGIVEIGNVKIGIVENGNVGIGIVGIDIDGIGIDGIGNVGFGIVRTENIVTIVDGCCMVKVLGGGLGKALLHGSVSCHWKLVINWVSTSDLEDASHATAIEVTIYSNFIFLTVLLNFSYIDV